MGNLFTDSKCIEVHFHVNVIIGLWIGVLWPPEEAHPCVIIWVCFYWHDQVLIWSVDSMLYEYLCNTSLFPIAKVCFKMTMPVTAHTDPRSVG